MIICYWNGTPQIKQPGEFWWFMKGWHSIYYVTYVTYVTDGQQWPINDPNQGNCAIRDELSESCRQSWQVGSGNVGHRLLGTNVCDYVGPTNLELLLLDEFFLKVGPGHVKMHIELRHCACALCSSFNCDTGMQKTKTIQKRWPSWPSLKGQRGGLPRGIASGQHLDDWILCKWCNQSENPTVIGVDQYLISIVSWCILWFCLRSLRTAALVFLSLELVSMLTAVHSFQAEVRLTMSICDCCHSLWTP